jgi:mRNA interferase RelE/StbE
MPWSLEVANPARKDLRALPKQAGDAVAAELDRLIDDPASADIRKLAGRQGEWRLRVGEYRAILQFDNSSGTIVVKRILPRREAYRG